MDSNGFHTIKEMRELKRKRQSQKPHQMIQTIPTGFSFIDNSTGGIKKGGVTIITGPTGRGKSTLASMIMLNLINDGNKVFLFDGELSAEESLDVLISQAAGAKRMVQGINYMTERIVPEIFERKIVSWLNDKIIIYNREYPWDINSILNAAEECAKSNGTNIVILNSLVFLEISDKKDKSETHKQIAAQLTQLCAKTGITVILVAHCHKYSQILSIDDVDGEPEITSIADAVFATYIINRDFVRKYCKKYKTDKNQSDDEFIEHEFKNATNVLSIIKPRFNNAKSKTFDGLWYEYGSRRLLNYEGEQPHFGWEDKSKIEQEKDN